MQYLRNSLFIEEFLPNYLACKRKDTPFISRIAPTDTTCGIPVEAIAADLGLKIGWTPASGGTIGGRVTLLVFAMMRRQLPKQRNSNAPGGKSSLPVRCPILLKWTRSKPVFNWFHTDRLVHCAKIHIVNRRSLYSSPVVWQDGQAMLRRTIMIYNHDILEKPEGKLFVDHVLRNYA
ncbi:hypothetical protein AXX12_10700 [Anaerosporomusa subterranea]|uniref:Uncharacterized protein n=1 Tax=Anaerosporomusa subterranea TaxID=1794912 RepID=A0A154BNX1_ANASB|nr:hypothetical protein [Anaerosporomusa subterranea]KYZ75674.1 hypothetical protein AXX12_10700 [Anaerosporomusa subterranea]